MPRPLLSVQRFEYISSGDDAPQAPRRQSGIVDRAADPRRPGEGEFDRLEGAGKPLPELAGTYDPEWWLKKLVRRERLSLIPEALRIRATVEHELERIWKLSREVDVRTSVATLNAEIAKANHSTISGPPTSVAMLDLARWRQRRAAG